MLEARRDVRLALVASILAGLQFLVSVPILQPEQVAFASDVYYHATDTFLAGGDPYAATPPDNAAAKFRYPPVVLLAFVPHVLTGSPLGAYVLQTTLNLLTVAALAWLLLSVLDAHDVDLGRLDRALVVGFLLASVHTTTVLVMGQVNLQLALAIAVGAVLVERGREVGGGVALALAASVKGFPATVGAWLLRDRDWRAVGTAVATGTALLVVGVVVAGPDALVTYVTEVVPSEAKAAEFAGGLPPDAAYVTVRRPIAALFSNLDPALYLPLAALVVVPVVAACYRDFSTPAGRMTALLATVLGTLLLLPLEAFYFSLLYYPLIPLLFVLESGWTRRLLATGTVLLSTIVSINAIGIWLGAIGLPVGLETALLDLVTAAFTVAQPPLVGAALVLAACVRYQRRLATGADANA